MIAQEYRLKADWKAVGDSASAKKLSEWMNAVSLQLNSGEILSGGTIRPTQFGLRLEVAPSGKAANFAVTKADDVVTVQPGSIIQHGIKEFVLTTAGTVTLTGSTEWVYLEVSRDAADGSPISVKHSATKPVSNSTVIRLRLKKYELSSGGSYDEIENAHVGGDFHFDTPM